MKTLIRLLLSGAGVYLASRFVPGVSVDSYKTAVIVVLILGLVNFLIKPLLIILTLPLNILTLGLFTFVINGIMVILVANIVKGFYVESLLAGIVFSIVISLLHGVINTITH